MSLGFSMRRILGFGRCLWMWRILRTWGWFSRLGLRMWSILWTGSGLCARRGFRVGSALGLRLAFVPRGVLYRTWRVRTRCTRLLRCARWTRNIVCRLSRWRLCRGLSCRTLAFRFIGRSCLLSWYTGAKCSRFRGSCDCRLPLVHRHPLLRVRPGSLRMLSLSGDWGHMLFVCRSLLLRVRTGS